MPTSNKMNIEGKWQNQIKTSTTSFWPTTTNTINFGLRYSHTVAVCTTAEQNINY